MMVVFLTVVRKIVTFDTHNYIVVLVYAASDERYFVQC